MIHYVYNSLQFLKQVVKQQNLKSYSVLRRRDFSWIENYKLLYELYIIASNKISGMHFFPFFLVIQVRLNQG